MVFLVALLVAAASAQLNGPQVPLFSEKYRFVRQFVPGDLFDGQRCTFTGNWGNTYDQRNPGQLFQSCYGAAIYATVGVKYGSSPVTDTTSLLFYNGGISGASVVALGTEDSLTKRYNITSPQGSAFASISVDAASGQLQIAKGQTPGDSSKITFQPIADDQLQGLLDLKASTINATAGAGASAPTYFLIRLADSNTAPKTNLTGAALLQELNERSLGFVKAYVLSIAPLTLHWEVISASKATLAEVQSASNNQSSGDDDDDHGAVTNDVAIVAVVLAVVSVVISIVLATMVHSLRRSQYQTLK